MSSMRKITLSALGIVLTTGVFFTRQSVAWLSKSEADKSDTRSYRKLAEAKFRPIDPPVDVMVNPLLKPLPEVDLCVLE